MNFVCALNQLRVEPVGPAFDLSVPLEILIGTIPLNAVVQRFVAAYQLTPPTPHRHALPALPGYGPAHGHHGAAPDVTPKRSLHHCVREYRCSTGQPSSLVIS